MGDNGAVCLTVDAADEEECVGDTERVSGVSTVALSHRLRSVVVTFRRCTKNSGS
jgi:hypothetical protein